VGKQKVQGTGVDRHHCLLPVLWLTASYDWLQSSRLEMHLSSVINGKFNFLLIQIFTCSAAKFCGSFFITLKIKI